MPLLENGGDFETLYEYEYSTSVLGPSTIWRRKGKVGSMPHSQYAATLVPVQHVFD